MGTAVMTDVLSLTHFKHRLESDKEGESAIQLGVEAGSDSPKVPIQLGEFAMLSVGQYHFSLQAGRAPIIQCWVESE